MNEDNKNINQLFIYTPHQLKTPLYLKNQQHFIDFSKDDDKNYYTSYYLDKNAYNYLTSFNDDYFHISEASTYIYPFCQSLHFDNISNMAIYVYSEDIEVFKNELTQLCLESDIDLKLFDNTENFYRADDQLLIKDDMKRLFYALIICFLAYIVAYCALLAKENKKIAVYMLNGYYKLSVAVKLYLPLLMKSFLIFVLTMIVFTFIFTNIHDELYILLYKRLIKYCGYFMIFIPIAMVCIFVYIHFSGHYLNLKNNRYLNQVLYTNYVMKIIIGLILLQPFCSIVETSLPVIKNHHMMTQYQDMINSNQKVRGNLNLCNQELLDQFMEMGYFCDFETYRVYSDVNNSLLYDDNGNFEEDIYMRHPFIMVNKNYLNVYDYQLIDIDGQAVEISQLDNNTFLVPKKYQNTDLQPYFIGLMSTPKIIYVEKTGDYFDFSVNELTTSYSEPIIRVFDKFSLNYMTNSNILLPINSQYNDLFYQNLLKKYGLENELSFVKTEIYYQHYLQITKEAMINLIGMICIYTFVFGLFLYQSTYTYFIKNAKKIAVEYLLGINRFLRFCELIIQNICVYLVICILSLVIFHHLLENTLKFVVVFIIVELIIQILMFRYIEKHKLIQALKGE